MTQVTNLALIRAQAGRSDDLGRRLAALVEPSRAEAACVNYDVHQSNTDRDLWMVYENWRSAEDLAIHFTQPHMQAFVALLPSLVEGDMDLRSFTMTSAPAQRA
jgi:quinol monooxygenase YgiN